MPEPAGELYVSITGDISALLSALQQGEDAAKAAGEAIAAALDTGTADASFKQLGDAAQTMGDQAKQAGEGIAEFATETEAASEALKNAAPPAFQFSDAASELLVKQDQLNEAVTEAASVFQEVRTAYEQGAASAQDLAAAQEELDAAIEKVTPDAEESEGVFAKLSDTFKEISGINLGEALTAVGLADLAKEALEAYAGVQKADIALTALTGSATKAEDAIAGLKNLALQDALSFPTLVDADQRMTALGFDLEKIPTVLQAAADAAAATGRGFETVTNAIDRMVLSGAANSRMLASLGISLQDLGAQLGVSADKASAAFKALDPSDRVDVIVAALNKYQGVAAQVAQGIAGQWQNLKTEWDFILEDMGAQLAPLASTLMSVVSDGVLPFGKAVVDQFASGAQAVTEFVQTMKDVESQFVTELANMTGAINLFRQAQQFLRDNGAGDFELMIPGVTDLAHAVNGLSLAFQTLSNTGPQIDQMTQSIAQHMTKLADAATMGGIAFRNAWNLSVAEDQGTISAAIEKVIDAQQKANDAVVTAKGVYDALNQSYQAGTALANGYVVTQQDVNRALQLLTTAEKAASDQIKVHKDNFDALVASLQKAQETFANAKTILEQTATAFQNGTVGIGALDQAYMKVESAAKSAGQTFSDVTIKAELMTKAAQDQFAALTTAVEVWQKLKDGSIPGSQAAIADALNSVDAAAKKVGISVNEAGGGLKFVADSATAAKGPVGDLANTLNGLAGIQETGVIVNGKWVAALNQGADAADKFSKDVTVSFENVGGSISDFADAADLDLESVTGYAGVLSGEVTVLKGSVDNAAISFQKVNETLVYTDNGLTNTTDLVKKLNKAWDDDAKAAEGAAGALKDAANAATAVGVAAQKATKDVVGLDTSLTIGSKSENSVAGGKAPIGVLFENLASIVSNPLASAQGSFTSNDLDNLATAIGLFKTGNNQYSSTDPNANTDAEKVFQSVQAGTYLTNQATATLQNSATQLQTSSTTLSTGSTQLQTASAALTSAATTTTTSSAVIQTAASQLGTAAAAMGTVAPVLNTFAAVVAPILAAIPGGAARGAVTTTTGASGPTTQLLTTEQVAAAAAATLALTAPTAQQLWAANIQAPTAPKSLFDPSNFNGSVFLQPKDAAPTVHVNVTGNTISSQAAADNLAKTIVDKLRNQAGLKLTGF